MSKAKKRIEAIGEIFESEKSYVKDLLVWERDFRIWMLDYPLFTPKVKYEICDRVFINMDRIRRLHERICEDIKSMNDGMYSETAGQKVSGGSDMAGKTDGDDPHVRRLEYVSIYNKYLDEFEVYIEYSRRLPKGEFELERLMYRHPEFSRDAEDFLRAKSTGFLGTKHFLYRPSQKLARYPLLLRAVAKNEEGDLREAYEALIGRFAGIARNVDKEFERFGTQFAIYRLGENFRYKEDVRSQQCLALFQKKRKLLKEGEVLVRSYMGDEPVVHKVFVFDHLILLCDPPQNKFSEIYISDEPLFMTKLAAFRKDIGFFPGDRLLEKLAPLFLLETGGSKVWGLYFGDKGERDVYYSILQKAIQKVRRRLQGRIVFETLPVSTSEPMRYVCQANRASWRGESTTSESEEGGELSSSGTLGGEDPSDPQEHYLAEAMSRFLELRKERQGEGLDRQFWDRYENREMSSPLRRRSLWRSLFPTADFFVSSIKFPLPLDRDDDPEYASGQAEMYIVAMEDGVYRFLDGRLDKILDRSVEKIIYDPAYEIMIYQSESVLYASHFNVESTSMEENVLKKDIENFFYGRTKQGSCLASVDSGNDKSISIFLFLVVISNGTVQIELSRKLCVGFQVFNVFFCSEKIVMACKDFEVVDMDTLRTEELLQAYDPFIPVIFHGLKNTTARSILPITQHTFLVCFDAMGFLIDDTGRLKRTDILFLWDCRPVDFKLAENHVICLGHSIINIFDLRTGVLVFTRWQDGLRFVSGSLEPLLHDGRNFYRINFGTDGSEGEHET